MFAQNEIPASIHLSPWPVADIRFISESGDNIGDLLVDIATAVRRYKTESNIPLGRELPGIQIATKKTDLANVLYETEADIISITRARRVEITDRISSDLEPMNGGIVQVAIMQED